LPVKGGYLQTLADVRSDSRILIDFDSTGTVRRTKELMAPLAISAVRDDGQIVVGARRTEVLEIVEYRLRRIRN
jgi:hypothetical protein